MFQLVTISFFIAGTYLMYRSKTYIHSILIGFITSWAGLCIPAYAHTYISLATGGKGLALAFAFQLGWIVCLFFAFIASSIFLLIRSRHRRPKVPAMIIDMGKEDEFRSWIENNPARSSLTTHELVRSFLNQS